MDKYKEYLAANVLQENRPINYKLLSRELKVHVHQAKQMLYHFHATENQKKQDSVHATYIITGTRLAQTAATQTNGTHLRADEDVAMRSSPIPSSLPDAPEDDDQSSPKVTLIKLVGEEDLEETKAQFEEITSVHVYSIEPGPLKDLQVLSECNRQVVERFSDEDPLEAWKTYGCIHYPHARRRTPGIKPQAAAPVATSATAKTAPRPSTTTVSKQKEAPTTGNGSQKTSRPSTPQVDPAALPNKKGDKANLKKEASSIFASFAKTQPKKKTAGSGASTPAAKSAEHSQTEDEPMKDVSDEEGEDDDVITGSNKSKEEASEAIKKARAAREAKEKKLREMMDEDDDDTPMGDASAASAEEPEEPEEATIESPAEPEPVPEKKEEVTVSNGRRRGRRRVMKKRTFQDAEGYFVTKEEPVWESFSEDEPEPKKPKPMPATTSKAKKGGGKQGQGSIMSFFAKKGS